MTVIAWDKSSLSWDSQVGLGDIYIYSDKHLTLSDGRIVVLSGDLAALPRVAVALDGKGWPSLDSEDVENSEILVLCGKRLIFYGYGSTQPSPVNYSFAWGSGGEVALGALGMGATSSRACAVATKYVSSCGGPILSVAATNKGGLTIVKRARIKN